MEVKKLSLTELLLVREWLAEISAKQPAYMDKESIHSAVSEIKKVDNELSSRILYDNREKEPGYL